MLNEVGNTVGIAHERPSGGAEWGRGPTVDVTVIETTVHWVNAFLHNGSGRYDDAFDAAVQAATSAEDPTWEVLATYELVEAAARSGRRSHAQRAHRDLCRAAGRSGTSWARGIRARSCALVVDDVHIERHLVQAVELLGQTGDRLNHGRALLLYGEWLRRSHRRVDARKKLHAALEVFTDLGLDGFAQRTRRELLATGETVRKRSDETRTDLTPQEAEIARLAGAGRTNREIGLELYISSRTVEWHLRKVFTKLGLRSRRELRTALEPSTV
ncbi:MAG TPA: LuxR C-terminal-related transcriptional regulator [Aquihabitans sp.]|jgi:DNA-binding CsgD family transcriptional regulator|nr:LuxR C-terminal-related transcriptional regulator [Aquihabitans sp.]